VPNLLDGMRILVLEDELLIAMDVEQLCRDHGAHDIIIVRSLGELQTAPEALPDAAIVDVMLGGESTLDFAKDLHARGIPFVFASGYTQSDEIFRDFPGVALVGKPYSGDDLMSAVAEACRRVRPSIPSPATK